MEVVVGIFVKVARWLPWISEDILTQYSTWRAEAVSPTPQRARRSALLLPSFGFDFPSPTTPPSVLSFTVSRAAMSDRL